MASSDTMRLNVCLSFGKKGNPLGLPMNKKYRSHFDVMASILESSRYGGATPTSIMRIVSLNHRQLKKYLTFLVEMGFVNWTILEKNQVLCRAGDKGIEFLRHYYALQEMLSGSEPRKLLSWAER